MSTHDDGGTAYPIENAETCVAAGMSLLDLAALYAMQAMIGRLSEYGGVVKNDERLLAVVAREAYCMADAMVAEKRRREQAAWMAQLTPGQQGGELAGNVDAGGRDA